MCVFVVTLTHTMWSLTGDTPQLRAAFGAVNRLADAPHAATRFRPVRFRVPAHSMPLRRRSGFDEECRLLDGFTSAETANPGRGILRTVDDEFLTVAAGRRGLAAQSADSELDLIRNSGLDPLCSRPV
jgi:hypothetical protein